MPRQSSAVRASAAPKRRASARLSASQAEVKRVKSNASLAKSTTKKSKYFESDESSAEDAESSEAEASGSVFEEANQSSSAQDSDSVPEEEVSNSDEDSLKMNPRAKGRGKKQAQGTGSEYDTLKGKELWREGVKTGLGPGKEVFIAKPKQRGPGNVPYRDETLHPNTRLFLLDLAKNNEREWLKGWPRTPLPSSTATDVWLQRMMRTIAPQRKTLRLLSRV